MIELAQKKSSDFEATFQAKAKANAKDPAWAKAVKFARDILAALPTTSGTEKDAPAGEEMLRLWQEMQA